MSFPVASVNRVLSICIDIIDGMLGRLHRSGSKSCPSSAWDIRCESRNRFLSVSNSRWLIHYVKILGISWRTTHACRVRTNAVTGSVSISPDAVAPPGKSGCRSSKHTKCSRKTNRGGVPVTWGGVRAAQSPLIKQAVTLEGRHRWILSHSYAIRRDSQWGLSSRSLTRTIL